MKHEAKAQGPWTQTSRTLWMGPMVLALLVPCQTAFAGGMGNTPPSVDSISVSPTPINTGGLATITCDASDSNGQVTGLQVTVSGGTLAGGGTHEPVSVTAGANVSGSIGWNTPAPGTYDITCTASDDGGLFGGSSQTAVTVQVEVTQPVGNPPKIDKFEASNTEVLPGAKVEIASATSDEDGDTVSLTWQASGGQLNISGNDAIWTAPATYGNYTVEVTADDGTGNKTTAKLVIQVAWAVASSPIASGIAAPLYPERLTVNPAGQVFVSDSRARNVAVYGANGVRQRTIDFDGRPAGIAAGSDGRLYIGDLIKRRVVSLNGIDQVTGALGSGNGEFNAPLDIAVATQTGKIYVADGESGQVKVYDGAGQKVQTLSVPGGMISGVAVTPSGDAVYASNSRTGKLHIFDAQGTQTGTLGTFGGQAGQLSRSAGIAVDDKGHVVVVDAYQSRVVIFKDGQALDQIGSYGEANGQMKVPLDVVFDQGGRLLVTNTQLGRLEVLTPFGSATPVCTGDKDCDTMADSWELANGLNPDDPNDAGSDGDTDGLTNAQEFAYQTNPNKADSDDDGVADLVEIEQGKDPNDGTDQGLIAKAGADIETNPAHVELDGTASRVSGAAPVVWSWIQKAGPAQLELKNTDTARPSFVARAAGTYSIELKVGDGANWSTTDEVQVTVNQVTPVADGGMNIGLKKGKWGTLDGLFSHDANGEKLTYQWKQVLGDDLKLQSAWSPQPVFETKKTGTYAFELVVTDAAGGQSEPDRVWVTVHTDKDHVPVAAGAAWSEAKVGTLVALDASMSVDSDATGDEEDSNAEPAPTLEFTWEQVNGPEVSLQGATTDSPIFLASEVGLYAFEVRVDDGTHTSPPHRMEVAVRAQTCGDACASLDAGAEQRVTLGAEAVLSCTALAGVNCEWEQIEGVTTRLSGQGHKRTLVPLESGSYAFRLRTTDAFGPGGTDVTWVVVDNPAANLVPVAVVELATKVTKIRPGRMVTLRGKDSLDGDPKTKLGHVWTQVQGPAVALLSTFGKNTRMKIPMAGDYAFEMRVDDGIDRSPPAKVSFTAVKIGQGEGD